MNNNLWPGEPRQPRTALQALAVSRRQCSVWDSETNPEMLNGTTELNPCRFDTYRVG